VKTLISSPSLLLLHRKIGTSIAYQLKQFLSYLNFCTQKFIVVGLFPQTEWRFWLASYAPVQSSYLMDPHWE